MIVLLIPNKLVEALRIMKIFDDSLFDWKRSSLVASIQVILLLYDLGGGPERKYCQNVVDDMILRDVRKAIFCILHSKASTYMKSRPVEECMVLLVIFLEDLGSL
jgi:hypothetical protein